MINELNLQEFIFSHPSRIKLMNYQGKSDNSYKISVYRNHSFEMVEHTIKPYLDYADIKAEFIYSDYDDSLTFLNLDISSDLLILWVDFSRYNTNNMEDFIHQRIEYLKTIYKKTILFVPFESNIQYSDNQVVTYSLEKIKQFLGEKYTDERLEAYSGTKMSPSALLMVSKDLGLNYIPSLLKTTLKGIVVDLDNTLYKGVLGEDGIQNLILTPSHIALQEKLKTLSQQGFFLCIASKNEQKDVFEMFNERKDFPLQLNDFTKICANWNSKASSITTITEYLNINEDSLIFIDDNLGELVSVKNEHPNIHLIHADENAQKTLDVLSNYPRLLKFNIAKEDAIRKSDTQANETRSKLFKTLSKEDYLKDLQLQLTFTINDKNNINRISELSNKTNQFIFNYARYSVSEVENLISSKNSCVVTVSLKDRLSDSGIIGVVAVRKNNQGCLLEECFVSCRALGRGLDEVIVLGAISFALKKLDSKKLKILIQKGERNAPALNFANKFLGNFIKDYSDFNYKIDEKYLTININKG